MWRRERSLVDSCSTFEVFCLDIPEWSQDAKVPAMASDREAKVPAMASDRDAAGAQLGLRLMEQGEGLLVPR
jgi:hypothetical protein